MLTKHYSPTFFCPTVHSSIRTSQQAIATLDLHLFTVNEAVTTCTEAIAAAHENPCSITSLRVTSTTHFSIASSRDRTWTHPLPTKHHFAQSKSSE